MCVPRGAEVWASGAQCSDLGPMCVGVTSSSTGPEIPEITGYSGVFGMGGQGAVVACPGDGGSLAPGDCWRTTAAKLWCLGSGMGDVSKRLPMFFFVAILGF